MESTKQYVAEKQYTEALAALSEVIKIDPFFAEAYNRRATVHFGLKCADDCFADIERVSHTRAPTSLASNALSCMPMSCQRCTILMGWLGVISYYLALNLFFYLHTFTHHFITWDYLFIKQSHFIITPVYRSLLLFIILLIFHLRPDSHVPLSHLLDPSVLSSSLSFLSSSFSF